MTSIAMKALARRNTARIVLLLSGLTAVVIAAMILLSPEVFYGSYGIQVRGNVALANELKAPAGALLLAGLVMIAGVFRSDLFVFAMGTAAFIYLSYGLSRLTSFLTDGIPNDGLIGATGLELAIGTVCLFTFLQIRKHSSR